MTADAVGGVWQYSVDLAKGLASHGWEVLLATMGPRPSVDQLHALQDTPGVSLVHGDFALEWTREPWCDVDRSTDWLLELAGRFAPDIVHLNGYSQAAADWNAPVMCVAHSCVFSWWQAVHGCDPPSDWIEYQRRIARGLQASTAIVAPSNAIAEAISTHYAVARENIEIIHNFSSAQPSRAAQKEAFLLAAGRFWDKAKNIGLLTGICRELRWPLHVAGDSDSVAPSDARVLGRLSHRQVLDQMTRASIFIHPALYEPFGLAVLEAAQAGCCLVLADIPSLRELWDEVAVFVDPAEADSWVRQVNSLIAGTAERERFAELARCRAKSFTCERTLASYERAYALALNKKSMREGVAA